MAAIGKRLVNDDLMAAVTEAFGKVLTLPQLFAQQRPRSRPRGQDRELAGNRRDAGRATDADVLQLDVYLAHTLEQQVQAMSTNVSRAPG
jgi:hypothetical protein